MTRGCGSRSESSRRFESYISPHIFLIIMVEKIDFGLVKCNKCSSLLRYTKSDIEERECAYGVQSYAGETYIGLFITCPQCGNKIEVT